MKNKYNPYMIDIKYEFRTYRNVGQDYGNFKRANLGFISNFIRFIRRTWNRKQTKYRFCNTYSDWEEHITTVLNKDIVNYDDMLHWLIGKRNYAKQHLEAIKAILIPIYVALIGVYDVFLKKEENSLWELIILLLCIIAISVFVLFEAIDKVDFFDELVKMAKKNNRKISGSRLMHILENRCEKAVEMDEKELISEKKG